MCLILVVPCDREDVLVREVEEVGNSVGKKREVQSEEVGEGEDEGHGDDEKEDDE